MPLSRWVGRGVGLDVHREFCVVAIREEGLVRSAGRVPEHSGGRSHSGREPAAVGSRRVGGDGQSVGRSLGILEPHVDRVIVVSPDDTGIRERASEDRPA